MIKEDRLEYPSSLGKDDIRRMENVIEILKRHRSELKEIKDKESNFYMRRKYQSMIDNNMNLINFLAIRTIGD